MFRLFLGNRFRDVAVGIKDAELKGYVSKAVDAILRDCLMEEEFIMAKLEELCKEEI